jgi:hypothetical protein
MNALHTASRRGGIGFNLILFLAILFACLAVAWMILLPFAVTRLVQERSGFGIEIQTFYANPFTANLEVRGLVITNPPAFPRKDFVEVREFRVDAQLFSLFGRRPVIDYMVVNMTGITLVKDQRGLINTRVFQEGLAGPSPDSPPPPAAAPAREFLIKRLQVRLDRLVIADYSGRKPDVHEFTLKFSHTYENVTSAKQLAAPFADIFAPVAGAIGGILPEADAALRAAGGRVKETGRKTGEAVKGLFDALEKTLKK